MFSFHQQSTLSSPFLLVSQNTSFPSSRGMSFTNSFTEDLFKVNFVSVCLKISVFILPSFLKGRVLDIEFGAYWSVLSMLSKYYSTVFCLPLML